MRIHEVAPKTGSKKRPRRVGRGVAAGQGASCGFGMRGQKSRSGTGTKPGFEGGQMPLYRRVPKLKHFPLVNQHRYTIVNVGKLNSLPAKAEVTLEILLEYGIVTSKTHPLKVLGDGELKIPLQVKAAAFSDSAIRKIEAAGGCYEILSAKSQKSRNDDLIETGFVATTSDQDTIPKKTSAPFNPEQEGKQTMAVIKMPDEDGYKKFNFHSQWLDVAIAPEVAIEQIPKVDNVKQLTDEDIAYKYLQNTFFNTWLQSLVLEKDQKLKYAFISYDAEEIDFTKTSIVKFLQYYHNFPLYGSLVTVELDEDKELLSISSTIGDLSSPNIPVKEISEQKVLEIVKKSAGYESSVELEPKEPNIKKCWYYNTDKKEWQLSYIVEDVLKAENVDQEDDWERMPEVFDYVVDISTGNLIDEIPRVQ